MEAIERAIKTTGWNEKAHGKKEDVPQKGGMNKKAQ